MLRDICLFGLALIVSGCAVEPEDGPPTTAPEYEAQAEPADENVPTVALDTSKREPPCPFVLQAQPPLPVLSSPDPDAACLPHSRRDLRAAKKAFKSRYHKRFDDSRLEIDSRCDQLGTRVDELVMETSSGHGFSLKLDRLTRREDGDFDFLRVSFTHQAQREPGYCVSTRLHGRSVEEPPKDIEKQWIELGSEGGEVFRAVLPGDRVEQTLSRMRAELGMEAREIERPTPPGEIRLGGYWGSSRDFHVAYQMTDADGHQVGSDWAGYEGGGEQETWLPLDLASTTYSEMMWEESIEALLQPAEIDQDARDFFVDRFRAAEARNEEYGIWYVRERLMAMAQDIGDERLYASLVQAAAIPGKHSEQRTREGAAQALAVLSAWGPTEDGVTMLSPDKAAAHLVEACTGE